MKTDISKYIKLMWTINNNIYIFCLQVWNQTRPPWLEAVISPLEPILVPVVETLSVTFAGGCSLDQAMDVLMDCLIQLADCLPALVLRAAAVLQDAIPADVHPVADSVLLQLVVAASYSQLLAIAGNTFTTALAEALCSLDHCDRHNSKIEAFINAAVEW
jgi:hypothetical protein